MLVGYRNLLFGKQCQMQGMDQMKLDGAAAGQKEAAPNFLGQLCKVFENHPAIRLLPRLYSLFQGPAWSSSENSCP
jgi:hypothetical protein